MDENKKKAKPEERFIMQGIENPSKQLEDFWNTINFDKVNINILIEDTVLNQVTLILKMKKEEVAKKKWRKKL